MRSSPTELRQRSRNEGISMTQPSVIIVGAGPAGSVLAGLLAQHNVDTLVLDKARFPAAVGSRGTSPFALSIPRVMLDSALLRWARRAGARCVEGFRVTDLIREHGQVRGVTGIGPNGRETYQGQIVVGADGRDSVVARRLGLHRPHPTLHRA